MKRSKSNLILKLIVIFLAPYYLSAQTEASIDISSFSIGETLTFESSILNESRSLNVYLPDSYHRDSSRTYPVIYLLDGSREEDFVHIAGLVQFGSFSWIKMVPETIVVGIANVDRRRDFTYPTSIEEDRAQFPTTGHSEKFIAFIGKELKSIISNRYRCGGDETIIGQSLGGLLATEILFRHPNMFDNYIIVSPSLWWDNGSLLNKIPDDVCGNRSIFCCCRKRRGHHGKGCYGSVRGTNGTKKEGEQVVF